MRYFYATLIVFSLALIATPVVLAQNNDDSRGWTFYGRFQGISNDSGLIMKLDPSVGYKLNRYVEAYAGVPIYFVRESSTLLTGPNPGFMNGVGNAYIGGELSLRNPVLDYTSNLQIAVPTGDESRGFSTGRVTVDWNNNFSRTFSSLTPYGNIGLANTVSDTSFFVRPFSSDGLVGYFEGGALYDIMPMFSIGLSGYAIRASGEQRIVSRVITRTAAGTSSGRGNSGRVFQNQVDVTGLAELVNDHGFATWLNLSPQSSVDFQFGYNRSARYELDSLFFGVGFRVGR